MTSLIVVNLESADLEVVLNCLTPRATRLGYCRRNRFSSDVVTQCRPINLCYIVPGPRDTESPIDLKDACILSYCAICLHWQLIAPRHLRESGVGRRSVDLEHDASTIAGRTSEGYLSDCIVVVQVIVPSSNLDDVAIRIHCNWNGEWMICNHQFMMDSSIKDDGARIC